MTIRNEDQLAKRVAELETLDEVQDRIDRVAHDLSTGRHRYAIIDAWALGELLGVDFDDTGDWSRQCFVNRHELRDEGFEHPFAENVDLLKGKSPPARYAHLAALA